MADRLTLLKRFQLQEFPQPDLAQVRNPLFLCHGYGAIGSVINSGPLHDPCMELRSHGVPAIAPNIVPYARIETRAENWVRLIKIFCEDYGCEKVNVVAHSMGGLDMRYAITHLGASEYVSSLTTIASPHHGSSLADLILKAPELVTEKLSEMFDWFGDNMYPKTKSDALGSLEQLTCSYLKESFNPNTPDHDEVTYYSYSAAVGKGTEHSLNPVYKFQNNHIFQNEGPNDSFVSVESAKWGEHIKTVPLSHLAQMHIQVSKNVQPLYEAFWLELLLMLSEKGH